MIDYKKDILCIGKFYMVNIGMVKCLVVSEDDIRIPHFYIVSDNDNIELFSIAIYDHIRLDDINKNKMTPIQKQQLVYWLNSTYDFYGVSQFNISNWERIEDGWYFSNEIEYDDGSFMRLPMPDYNLLPI